MDWGVIHEQMFAVEIHEVAPPRSADQSVLGNLTAAKPPRRSHAVATEPEPRAWLNEHALNPFLERGPEGALRRSRADRAPRRAVAHGTASIDEDQNIGRFSEQVDSGVEGAAGNLKQAEDRHAG